MAKLVIMESPAKAKTVKKYLGSGYDVIASAGHIRDLPKTLLGVDVEHGFKPRYVDIPGKSALIRQLKAAAAESDRVYHRPGPGGRSNRLASGAAAEDAPGRTEPGHLQRDHPFRRADGDEQAPGGGYEPGERPTGAPGAGSYRGL